jgi:hypothetical protein
MAQPAQAQTLDSLYDIFTEAFIENSSTIIVVLFTSLTFIYQNFTGIVYLGFLLAAMVIRGLFIWGFDIGAGLDQNPTDSSGKTIKCIQPYGFNVGFSTFVFMFTFFYAFIPMFVYDDINIPLLIVYIVYFIIDLGFKTNKYLNCSNLQMNLIANFVGGASIGAIFSTSMLKLSSEFLFFNELSTSKEICSVKKEQAFKCKVNK